MEFKEIYPGMVFRVSNFGVKNFARVTRIGNGITTDIIYAVFVSPSDFTQKRRVDDHEWACWDFMYNPEEWEFWGRSN